MRERRVAILGAGPVGLEAALAASELGFPFTVYEAGADVAANVRSWGHVRLFTPWSMNVSARMRRALTRVGREVPGGGTCPTGRELVCEVLGPVASLPEIEPHVRRGSRVVEVGREGLLKSDEIGTGGRAGRPFRMLVRSDAGVEGLERADVVLDCSGTWHNPNPLGAGGIRAPGEERADEHIVRRIPDLGASRLEEGAPEWANRRILLVGAGHSAQTAARDLHGLVERFPETSVVWVIWSDRPDFGAVEDDPLPEREALVRRAGELASGSSPFDVRPGRGVEALDVSADGVVVTLRSSAGGTERVTVDR
ncbi:MAG TPA: flavoprotein, partial [Alphaproteobacteria bacterium]|nr:flavoprotein [Alphaproteobacteria bacterium]